MAKRIRKFFIRGLFVVIIALLGLLFYAVTRPLPPPTPLPNPNGYDDFVKAGRMIIGEQLYEFSDWTPEKLRGFLTTNAEPLQLLRIGLAHKSRIPVSYSVKDLEIRVLELPAIKNLALAVAAEGRLAELEHHPMAAAKSYLVSMRLGQECCRGGVMIDKLVGTACEAIGGERLAKLITNLNAKECHEVIQTLTEIESNRESADKVLKTEKLWCKRATSWREMIGEMIESRTLQPMKPMHDNFSKKIHDRELITRKTMIYLAARAYELEKGERPKTIADLVPDYLKTIPLDPFTGTNMVYQP